MLSSNGLLRSIVEEFVDATVREGRNATDEDFSNDKNELDLLGCTPDLTDGIDYTKAQRSLNNNDLSNGN